MSPSVLPLQVELESGVSHGHLGRRRNTVPTISVPMISVFTVDIRTLRTNLLDRFYFKSAWILFLKLLLQEA